MKPLRHPRPRPFSAFALLLVLALFCLSSGVRAQDKLCYVLMTVPKHEAPIVRHEMATAPANHFADGEDFFTSTRGTRRLIYLGNADVAGQQRVELKKYLPPSLTYRGPWEKCDTTISIAAVRSGEGREPFLTVDAGVLVQGAEVGHFGREDKTRFTRYAATSQVPLRPNVWQEVAYWSVDHYCQMLWQYALVRDATKAVPADPEPAPLHRLEMIIGTLPEDSFASLPSSDAARRAMIAESSTVHARKWTAFSVHCLPGQPFSSRIALGPSARRNRDSDYESSCSSIFSGTLGMKLGSVALEAEFRNPAPKTEDRLVIPLAANLVPGEWHIQRIAEEPVIYSSGHTFRCKNEMIDGTFNRDPIRANAAFYRVVEVKR